MCKTLFCMQKVLVGMGADALPPGPKKLLSPAEMRSSRRGPKGILMQLAFIAFFCVLHLFLVPILRCLDAFSPVKLQAPS